MGLPPWEKNEPRWPLHRALLSDETLRPGRAHILACLHNMHMLLYVRRCGRKLHFVKLYHTGV